MNKTVTEITADDFRGATQINSYLLNNCDNLLKVTIPSTVTQLGGNAMSQCDKLAEVIFEGNVEFLNGGALSGNTALQRIDFTHCTSVPTLQHTSTLQSLPAACKILVPMTLVEQWKAATNWSTYESHIVGVAVGAKEFTLEGFYGTSISGGNTFNFDEGMTWAQWKASVYNSFTVYGSNMKFEEFSSSYDIPIAVSTFIDTPLEGIGHEDGTPVTNDEFITETTYYFYDYDNYEG